MPRTRLSLCVSVNRMIRILLSKLSNVEMYAETENINFDEIDW